MEVPQFRPRSPGNSLDDTDPVALLASWWRAVGAPMARLAAPRGIFRSRLIVAVPDTRWEHEIGKNRDEILVRLRRMQGLEQLEGVDVILEQQPREAAGHRASAAPPPPEEPSREAPPSALPDASTDLAGRWEAAVARILARRGERHAP